MLNRASELLGVKTKTLVEFVADDVFNGNRLCGVLCRQSDYRYGALVIFQVNDEKCEQIVWPTPKMHYPFDENGNFHWPNIQQVSIYDKIDGTNILAYHYQYQGQDLVTYKTRLTPTLRASAVDCFGDFLSLWRECLRANPWIEELIKANPTYNLSFELYGSRNGHGVAYNTSLDTAFLFGVRREDHVIKPPDQMKLVTGTKLPQFFACESVEDLSEVYNQHVQKLTEKNTDCVEGEFAVEGMMMYAKVERDPSWRQFKLKADQVRVVHWTASGTIHKMDIWTTCLNTYEHKDNPTVTDVMELLEEEYPKSKIDKSLERILKVFVQAEKHMALMRDVNKVYAEALACGFDVREDKNKTMRFMSKFFKKKEMNIVGSIVLKQAGLLETKTKLHGAK